MALDARWGEEMYCQLFLWPVTQNIKICYESTACSFLFTILHFVVQRGNPKSSTAVWDLRFEGLWHYTTLLRGLIISRTCRNLLYIDEHAPK